MKTKKTTPAQPVDLPRLVLRFDERVACWIDKRGNAWRLAELARVVNATRETTGKTHCAFCGRDQKTDDQRRMHMLNECRMRRSPNVEPSSGDGGKDVAT